MQEEGQLSCAAEAKGLRAGGGSALSDLESGVGEWLQR